MTGARVGYAGRDGVTRLHAFRRVIPVVFVPGLMGSRLTDPRTDALAWNPMGGPVGSSPGAFAADYDALRNISHGLVPDETHPFRKRSDHERVAHVRHFYNIIPEFYADSVLGLAAMRTPGMKRRGLRTRVYVAGYDWRQDGARGALRVAQVVEEALRETGERKVLLVAHSLGGLVSRYYCRVLGGESKVHQLVLLASPTLGAPDAYLQLKVGLQSAHLREVADDALAVADGAAPEDVLDLVDSAHHALATGLSAAASQANSALTFGKGMTGIKGFLGDLYLAFSLGAGRFLTREETLRLMRQLTSIYQLLPNGMLCEREPDMVRFDPLATGHPPVGMMVALPTLLDATAALTSLAVGGVSHRAGQATRDWIERARGGDPALFSSGRARRNLVTLPELFASTLTPRDDDDWQRALAGWTALKTTMARMFLDGRNCRELYEDIYTGFMDVPSLRATALANLNLFYRFDQALTLDAREPDHLGPTTLLSTVLGPIGDIPWGDVPGVSHVKDFLSECGAGLAEDIQVWSHGARHKRDLAGRMQKTKALEAEAAKEEAAMRAAQAEERARARPRVYMHPRTVTVYCDDLQTGSTAVLVPRAVVSRDDHNVVRCLPLPNYQAITAVWQGAGAQAANPYADLALGDGRVPRISANPPDEMLSVPPVARIATKGIIHADVPLLLAEMGDIGETFGEGVGVTGMEDGRIVREDRKAANPTFREEFERAIDDHLDAFWRS